MSAVPDSLVNLGGGEVDSVEAAQHRLRECGRRLRNSDEGIGRPEPVRGELSGLGSRRIDREHRVVRSAGGLPMTNAGWFAWATPGPLTPALTGTVALGRDVSTTNVTASSRNSTGNSLFARADDFLSMHFNATLIYLSGEFEALQAKLGR